VNESDNGELLSGQQISSPPGLLPGAAANPEGEPVDLQVLRLEKKVAVGADFIQTQAVFDIDHFKKWMAGSPRSVFHAIGTIDISAFLVSSQKGKITPAHYSV
jgi:5,10-methylenetetrahydrofolate reductase